MSRQALREETVEFFKMNFPEVILKETNEFVGDEIAFTPGTTITVPIATTFL